MDLRFSDLAHLPTLLAAVTLSAGCFGGRVGELQMDSKEVPLGGANSVSVELNIGVGELRLSGGAKELLNGEFLYNVASWKPEVKYEVNGDRGRLTVKQPSRVGSPVGNVRNEWNLSLNSQVPMDLHVELGVGKSNLELGDLSLTGLNIQTGVGESTLDLIGKWKKELTARIKGGVGEVTVRLPGNVGVRVEATKGIGSIHASGLKKENDVYINDAFGKTEVTLNIHIEAGIGEIRLEVV